LVVVNKHSGAAFDVDITRPSKWGNPFVVGRDGDRTDVVAMYRAHVLTQPELLRALGELAGKRLGCVCAPQLCHGDVLAELVRERVPASACLACRGRGYLGASPTKWDHVILDESFIRNPRSRVTEFYLRSFRDVPHRWLLTGLPNPEGPADYWTQLAWLDGRALGYPNFWSFRAAMFAPHPAGFGWVPRPGAAKEIDSMIGKRAFVLSRAGAGMPDRKVYEKRTLDLPPSLRRAYLGVERDFARDDAETKFAIVKWGWLRRMCGGVVDGRVVWPGKIDELLRLLRGELAGQQVVVWFAYNDELEIVARRLEKSGCPASRIVGPMSIRERRDAREAFQRGDARAICVQEALGRISLNLSAADTAIYYSNLPSYDCRAQSEDRIVLVGKKRPLLLLDLIARDTVDSDVRDLLTEKRWRSDASLMRAARERARIRDAV
jgi:hypothetical protein